jgi:hypothetical protein
MNIALNFLLGWVAGSCATAALVSFCRDELRPDSIELTTQVQLNASKVARDILRGLQRMAQDQMQDDKDGEESWRKRHDDLYGDN